MSAMNLLECLKSSRLKTQPASCGCDCADTTRYGVQASDTASRLQSATWQAMHPLTCLLASDDSLPEQAGLMGATIGKAGAEAHAVPAAALLPLLHTLRSPAAATACTLAREQHILLRILFCSLLARSACRCGMLPRTDRQD